TVSRPECLQLIGVHRVHHVVEQLAQFGITVVVVAALQQPVHSVVKILARGFQVPRFEVLLSRREFLLDFLDQVVLSGRNRRQQPDIVAPRRIQYRQGRKFHGSLLRVRGLWRGSQRRNVRLHGLLSRVFATEELCCEEQRTCGNVKPSFHLSMVRRASRPGQRFPQRVVPLSPRPNFPLFLLHQTTHLQRPLALPPLPCYSNFAFVALVSPLGSKAVARSHLRPFFC